MNDMDNELKAVAGPVLRPGDEGFDEERAGFNLAVRHRPDVIVCAVAAEDVRVAVEFAGARGLPVAVKSTGHGFSVPAEGGVLVSTRRMTGVRVDPDAGTAWVAAGARWQDVVAAAAPYGLAPLNGSAPHVGVVGYTLGGGLPLLGRSHGYAADRVRAMEVVTADGRLRHVTPDSEPDLYWALLGGRDNFGIVTGLEFGLVPVARLYGGGLYFDAVRTPGLLESYLRWTATVPEPMNSSVALIPMPDVPDVPEALRGRHLFHVRIAFTGSPEEGERLVAPLRAIGPALIDSLRDLPYAESASIHDDPPTPMPWSSDSVLLGELDDAAITTLAGLVTPGPAIVELRHLGGALSRPPVHPNAVGHRDARYLIGVLNPGAGDAPERAGLVRALAPWTVGRFVNLMGHGADAGPEQVRSAYEPATLKRLTTLKTAYDPEDTFRITYHLPPVSA
ncbi:FAD-binding oxidoreductase [Nonomuraea candida]|uniref:FAD-binding oxidoreductase n=1 Tax=Nonomuraea candida TaxID=359159 RepID=UPI000694B4C5|nr:FAD-binding oxidoreductase [Nonomuraea candida]